jgi:hypothetical protein
VPLPPRSGTNPASSAETEFRTISEMAGEEGFEPSLTDPESAVLPLDDSPATLKL